MLTTAASYRLIAGNLDRSLAAAAAQPQVARETAHYLANIGKVKSIDDFLANERVFAYAMKAFGLQEMGYAKAFLRKVLIEGLDARDSLANRLSDNRYRELVETFNFARYGSATTSFQRTQDGVVSRYVRQTLEESAGAENEGVRLALYFRRRAPEIRNAYGILADPALLKVVQTALGLPSGMSAGALDRQAEAIERGLDIAGLKDPRKLEKLLARFTSLWEISSPATLTKTSALIVSPPGVGIGIDVLASLQRLRLGGR